MLKLAPVFLACTLLACTTSSKLSKQHAELILHNGNVYTIDPAFSTASAFAVSGGKIIAVGTDKEILGRFTSENLVDAEKNFVYPGFIDAHAHFLGYGLSLQSVNLMGTSSWQDVLARISAFVKEKKTDQGEWITGRGWDQNDWEVKEFPNKADLDRLYPDNPVIFTRVDGHAAIANQKALDLAGIRAGQTLTGGDIEVKNGVLTGILIDNAIKLVSSKIPAPGALQLAESLADAQKNCFAVGLTTVDDCGLDYRSVLLMDSLQKAGLLKMRIYAMLSDNKENFDFARRNGRIKTDRLNMRSFKVYADGALGSRGAVLLQPYADRPDWHGFLLSNPEHFDSVATVLHQMDFQMNTHAIGDSGNRTILHIYGRHLKGKNDKRWRIEHAQVVNEADFHLFGKYSVIPSVQPTHATSDMYWAGERLGTHREKGAYAYQQLMRQNGWIPLGTDFPVEDISPFKTFYAAVFRQDEKQWPAGGYQPENALSRQDALRGMTIWAARSSFEEKEKGSIEPGKLADFIILNHDLMKVDKAEVLKTRVLATYVGGEKVHGVH